ncbi:MAG: DNA primase [Chloroflexi bacterium]|nr:DNA primase [Chloroflexota bacterium]
MALIQEIKGRADLVEVVSSYVSLHPSGKNFKALCPFHAEKTPSFYVFPDRQAWRCFGACASGGDVVSFVMRAEGAPFAEALKSLARRLGISLTTRSRDPYEELFRANDATAQFFHQHLLTSPEGREVLAYVRHRGLSPATVSEFRLGLSPSAPGDLLKRHLIDQGLSEGVLFQAGLLVQGPDNTTRELFHRRLMFPIWDARGRVVGFAGRSLDGSEPKYMNSPRTPLFDKGHLLYGLDRALRSIRDVGTGVIVEGYMDVIVAHQEGFSNVVASMGTSITEHQAAAIGEVAKVVVLALDPDTAGQEATLRSIESSWRLFDRPAPLSQPAGRPALFEQPSRPSLKVALLPQGQDPDEIILEDKAVWQRAVQEARPVLDFLMDLLPSRYNLGSPEGKLQASQQLLPLITSMTNPFEQDHYLRKLADLLQVSPTLLKAAFALPTRVPSVARPRSRRPPSRDAETGAVNRAPTGSLATLPQAARDPLEEFCLFLLLRYPDLRDKAASLKAECFQKEENRQLFTTAIACSKIDMESLDKTLQEHLELLLKREHLLLDSREREEAFDECARRLDERHLREMKLQEHHLLSSEPLGPPTEEVILSVNRRLHEVFARRSKSFRGG